MLQLSSVGVLSPSVKKRIASGAVGVSSTYRPGYHVIGGRVTMNIDSISQDDSAQQSLLAPSEKHLEDWIDANLIQFGDRFPEDEYYWRMGEAHFRNDNTFVLPFFDAIVAKQPQFPCGRPDLIGYRTGQISAIELKKGVITYQSIGQCLRYMHDLKEAFYWVFTEIGKFTTSPREEYSYTPVWNIEQSEYPNDEIAGMVVGSHLEDAHLTMVAAACGIQLVTYEYVNDEYLFTLLTVDRPHPTIYKQFVKGAISKTLLRVMKDRAEKQKAANR